MYVACQHYELFCTISQRGTVEALVPNQMFRDVAERTLVGVPIYIYFPALRLAIIHSDYLYISSFLVTGGSDSEKDTNVKVLTLKFLIE